MSEQGQDVIYVRLYSFVLKLYDVIEIADPSVIRWINNGTAFKVFDTKAFEETLLPKYYRHSKITSFQRQLNLYGFKRLTKGADAGAYYHSSFIQGFREQVKDIKRVSIKGAKAVALESVEDKENNFSVGENETESLVDFVEVEEADAPIPSSAMLGLKRIPSDRSFTSADENAKPQGKFDVPTPPRVSSPSLENSLPSSPILSLFDVEDPLDLFCFDLDSELGRMAPNNLSLTKPHFISVNV